MNAKHDVRPGPTALPSAARVIAVATAFALLGYGGLATLANHSAPTAAEAAALAASAAVAGTGYGSGLQRSSKVAPDALDAQVAPRECDSAKGITSNCVFE